MRIALLLLPIAFTLTACRATSAVQAAEGAPPVAEPEVQRGNAQSSRAVLNNELLPSLTNHVTVKMAAPLLQRPKAGSVILQTLAVGDTVQLLGAIENADGQWRSVAVGGLQGWVRAAQVSP